MAAAYAKWTGRLGCCFATTGPGGLHLLNGLYDAKMDLAPVVAHHRPALPRPRRDLHPAGRAAGPRLRRCRGLQRPRHGAQQAETVTQPGLPQRACPPRRGPPGAGRPTCRRRRREADSRSPRGKAQKTSQRWQDGLLLPDRRCGAPGGGDPERRAACRDPGRPRRAGGAGRSWSRLAQLLGRAGCQGAARQGGAARTTTPIPRAASADHGTFGTMPSWRNATRC